MYMTCSPCREHERVVMAGTSVGTGEPEVR